jgi:NAD(P)-dependent dehydrogenase (short-subunit alcohol dehydrogenase family)
MARVLGTGGAARAIVTALADEHMVIVLAGRNPAKARALLDELDPGGDHHAVDIAHFESVTDFAFDDRAGCLDLVVNASSLGMSGQPPLLFDMSHAPPGSVFYDIVTSPLETDFLRAAKAAGFRTDGLSMLIGQADHALPIFSARGRRAIAMPNCAGRLQDEPAFHSRPDRLDRHGQVRRGADVARTGRAGVRCGRGGSRVAGAGRRARPGDRGGLPGTTGPEGCCGRNWARACSAIPGRSRGWKRSSTPPWAGCAKRS